MLASEQETRRQGPGRRYYISREQPVSPSLLTRLPATPAQSILEFNMNEHTDGKVEILGRSVDHGDVLSRCGIDALTWCQEVQCANKVSKNVWYAGGVSGDFQCDDKAKLADGWILVA